MKHITDFFLKVVQTIHNKDEQYRVVIEAIYKIINFEIDKKNIKILGNTVYIRENPVIKNEINLKKSVVLDYIHTQLKTKHIVDIR